MYIVQNLSTSFDPARIHDPKRVGAVAWAQFNDSYAQLQNSTWRTINQCCHYPLHTRLLRMATMWHLQRTDAWRSLNEKARVFSQFDLPKNPDIVFFGAEVGWEALLIQAMFGNKGRVVLIDVEPEAYRRYRNAASEMTITAPPGWSSQEITLKRNPANIEYVNANFFDWNQPQSFDVGIDWGLLEHFKSQQRPQILKRFQHFLRPGALQISAVPRNTWAMRAFYRLFSNELNFGYRELMQPQEAKSMLESGDMTVVDQVNTPSTCIVLAQTPS